MRTILIFLLAFAATSGRAATDLEKVFKLARKAKTPGGLLESALQSFQNVHFSLLSHSDSQFKSLVSADKPRVVVAIEKDVILAFTAGSNVVEVINFVDGVFTPQSIEFPAVDNYFVEGSSRQPDWVTKVEINRHGMTGSCMACHIAELKSKREKLPKDFRPNWESYPFWSQAMYFAANGRVENHIRQSMERRVLEFYNGNLSKGLYRGIKSYLSKIGEDTPGGLAHLLERGNLNVTRQIYENNGKRIAKAFEADGFERYKDLFTHEYPLNERDDSWIKLLPADEQKYARERCRDIAKTLDVQFSAYNDVRAKLMQERYAIPSKDMDFMRGYFIDDASPSLVRVLYVAERLGIDTENWSPAFRMQHPSSPPLFQQGDAYNDIHGSLRKLARDGPVQPQSRMTVLCDRLKGFFGL